MTNSIVERIESDARAEAERTISAARERAEKIMADARERAAAVTAAEAQRAETDAAELKRRRGMVANLEVKKLDLASRRDVLDAAFRRALEKLCALKETVYEDFVARLIARYSEYGDKIVLAKNSPVDPSFIMALPEYESKTLRLENERGAFAGGLLLIGKKYDKRLTFEALFDESRVTLEPAIADELFGE